MRYDENHKQATRTRIVEAAGRRFKEDGIDGAGIAAVMSDAGLTNGAFYAHFESKEDLVANVLEDQLRTQRKIFDSRPSDRAGLDALVLAYLSPEHRDQYGDGCPSASLLPEIGRHAALTRDAFTRELTDTADDLASSLKRTDPESARVQALSLLGLLVGTLQLARAVSDPELSDQLLEQGVRSATDLLDVWSSR